MVTEADDNIETGYWRTTDEKAVDVAQAEALKEAAGKGGLRFEVFLPPGLAEWVLDFVARGVFTDPAEAVFHILREHRDLERHADLREESLRRSLQAAMDDPRPSISGEEFFEQLEREMAEPWPEPAIWTRRPVGDEPAIS